MKMWPILRRRLKNYENLVTYNKETEKVRKSLACEVLEASTRFLYFFCDVCIRVFHIFQILILFLSQSQILSLDTLYSLISTNVHRGL